MHGRDNHSRVGILGDILIDMGWKVWFDENSMKEGNIDSNIANGIHHCDGFVVCITEKYCRKVERGLASSKDRDNCAKEWECANVLKKVRIPVLMERGLNEPSRWVSPIVALHVGNCMHADASGSWDNEVDNVQLQRAALQIDNLMRGAASRRVTSRSHVRTSVIL